MLAANTGTYGVHKLAAMRCLPVQARGGGAAISVRGSRSMHGGAVRGHTGRAEPGSSEGSGDSGGSAGGGGPPSSLDRYATADLDSLVGSMFASARNETWGDLVIPTSRIQFVMRPDGSYHELGRWAHFQGGQHALASSPLASCLAGSQISHCFPVLHAAVPSKTCMCSLHMPRLAHAGSQQRAAATAPSDGLA